MEALYQLSYSPVPFGRITPGRDTERINSGRPDNPVAARLGRLETSAGRAGRTPSLLPDV